MNAVTKVYKRARILVALTLLSLIADLMLAIISEPYILVPPFVFVIYLSFIIVLTQNRQRFVKTSGAKIVYVLNVVMPAYIASAFFLGSLGGKFPVYAINYFNLVFLFLIKLAILFSFLNESKQTQHYQNLFPGFLTFNLITFASFLIAIVQTDSFSSLGSVLFLLFLFFILIKTIEAKPFVNYTKPRFISDIVKYLNSFL
jgi:hypothetical protein